MTKDRGSATVVGAVAISTLVFIAAFVVAVGSAELARHRAAGAADLAALAAAASGTTEPAQACARARWVTDQMAVDLDRCWFDGADALVEVSAGAAGRRRVHAHARAGPVEPDGDQRPVAHPSATPNARATVAPAR